MRGGSDIVTPMSDSTVTGAVSETVSGDVGPDASSRPLVSVIIPNWNGEAHLRECLTSLTGQSFSDFETFVVDNGSTDDGIPLVRREFPGVRIIENGANLGFAGAVNAGIRASDAPLLLLLNNDTRADAAFLERLVAAAEAHPEADSFAARMVLYSDPSLMNAAGDEFRFCRAGAENRGLRRPASEYDEPSWVFGACAGAAMYRAAFFERAGLFDEQYFLMHEDTDLNMRACLQGLRCLYVPDAVVAHKLGASINTMPSASSLRLAWRNEALVVGKTMPLPLLVPELACLVWRDLRDTLIVSPRAWHAASRARRLLGARIVSRWQGLVLGIRSRGGVPPRAVSLKAFLRSLRIRAIDR